MDPSAIYIGIIMLLSVALLFAVAMCYAVMGRLLQPPKRKKHVPMVPHVPTQRNSEKFKPIAHDDESLYWKEMEAKKGIKKPF